MVVDDGDAIRMESYDSFSLPLSVATSQGYFKRQGLEVEVLFTVNSQELRDDLASGKVLWECGGLTRNVIPSPVADAAVVYCMSGFMGNALLAHATAEPAEGIRLLRRALDIAESVSVR